MGDETALCWHAQVSGGCPAFCRCETCPEDHPDLAPNQDAETPEPGLAEPTGQAPG